jgi:spore maturation protein CgeB
MERQLAAVLADPDLRRSLTETGLAAIRTRHSCAHRVDELLAIDAQIRDRPVDLARCA